MDLFSAIKAALSGGGGEKPPDHVAFQNRKRVRNRRWDQYDRHRDKVVAKRRTKRRLAKATHRKQRHGR